MMPAVRIAAVRYAYAGTARGRSARPVHDEDPTRTVPLVDSSPQPALDGVDLQLAEGTLTVLLGPNGSGKSTLLRLVAGLAAPDAGSIEVCGAAAGSRGAAASTGIAFQSPSLDPRLTIRENLRCHAVLHGLEAGAARGRSEVLLETAGLREHGDRAVRTLSGGLARRVDLVRALLAEPRVLLLDEPTVGLDPTARAAFLDHVERIVRDRGVTVLLTTHLTDEADRGDRVVLMHRGRIVADGTPAALRAELGPRVVAVHGAEPPSVAEPSRWRRSGQTWTIEPRDDAELHAMLAQLVAAEAPVTIAPPTLADLFERLTGAELQRSAAPQRSGGAHP